MLAEDSEQPNEKKAWLMKKRKGKNASLAALM
jgi:hypothetical protein